MKNVTKSKLVCVIFSLLPSFSASIATATDSKSGPIIELVRDTGDCPKYSIRIFQDGTVEYEKPKTQSHTQPSTLLSDSLSLFGDRHSRPNHPLSDEAVLRKAEISLAVLDELKSEFHRIKFFDIRPMRFNAEKGTTLYDCKLDWDFLKRYPKYAMQCEAKDTVEVFARINHNLLGDSLFYRDGNVKKQVRLFRTMDGGHAINALQYRIDQVVDSSQWTGPNKCISPTIGSTVKQE